MNLRKYKELVYSIIGAAMEVHRELGGGAAGTNIQRSAFY